jgi:hypothetical protein
MDRYFTHQWSKKTALQQPPGLLTDTAGTGFLDRGVSHGDSVFVVTWFDNELHIVGALSVDRIVSKAQMRAILRPQGIKPWDAPEHVIAVPGTSSGIEVVDGAVLFGDAMDLVEFIDAQGNPAPVATRSSGKAEPQSFRGVREITPATADLFELLLTPKGRSPSEGRAH